jgi:hypothetical protein
VPVLQIFLLLLCILNLISFTFLSSSSISSCFLPFPFISFPFRPYSLPEVQDGSVGIATCNRLDGIWIASRWRLRFSAPVQTSPGAHPASYTMGTESFPGVKRPGRGVVYPPHLAPKLKEAYSYNMLPLWAFVACPRVNFTITFTLSPLPPSQVFILCYFILLRLISSFISICTLFCFNLL